MKEQLSASVRTDLSDYESDCYESLCVHLHSDSLQKLTCGEVYRRPSGDLVKFNIAYNSLLDKFSNEKSKCFIAGDLDINLLNYEKHNL